MRRSRNTLLYRRGLITLLLIFTCLSLVFAEDLVFDGIYEYAVDLPRILYLLKRDPSGDPLEIEGNFVANWAFLDTGASGIVIAREMVDVFELGLEPTARYVDVGVGGEEEFWVTEPLYIGTADYEASDPCEISIYNLNGPFRFQVTQDYIIWPEEPMDILGIPVMAGYTAVFHPGATNDLEYFSARVTDHDDTTIPAVDFNIALRFEKFITPDNSGNIPPLPVLAYNPVIDNITAVYNGQSSSGTWLLDTGASISLISTAQGQTLGLVDAQGDPVVMPLITMPIGGVGQEVNINVFQIDRLKIPTLKGFDLVFENARIGVHDIGVYDEQNDRNIILDGVFGSNFLCMSAELDPVIFWPTDLALTPFNRIVLDTRNALLGFDVFDEYPIPSGSGPVCGDPSLPWPVGDTTRDCIVDLDDYLIFVDEWLNACDWLNGNCRGVDLNTDGNVNLNDLAGFIVN